ncbi:acetylornithine transaminase [Candidatus Thiothrix sp. Deng01]|uniref:Acetylornithine transaminase n=1 Tax=Candidatus Thiothrix phosphatis TaxID=3112415 RepID=A0ABU6CZM8_9GAMM|nr:acetylornithine transaminase [Candidatus Thiothrix sp. Deng01]MEB4592026.1 acetylornithine transaminase [Candidatus Thiothrix sp. Deng01]
MQTKADNPFHPLMQIAPRPDAIFEQGAGGWLTDNHGKRYLDFIQGWAVNTLGHCPDAIVQALTQQAGRLINASPAFYNRPLLECAAKLTQHSAFDQVFFANSGAEANEGAIKLARKWGQSHKNGAWKIITFANSFHGRTLTTMAASGKPAFATLFEPKTPGFHKVPFNDAEAVRAAIDADTVAIMLEPIQGEAGVIPATTEFMQALRALADDHRLLLICDEVQTGMGRTGDLFAYQGYGVEPDVMTLGKGLGGGVPISALLAKTHACVFAAGEQGGTYNGNPLMTAVAATVLDALLEPDFLPQARARSAQMLSALESLSRQFGLGEVRGKGLLLALDTGDRDAAAIAQDCFARGLLINAPQPHTLRFMPALNVSAEEISLMAGVLGDSLNSPLQ